MSEYWKSTPKYWCKHCSTYVKDTPFERKQHETTGKHQGNLKRFLRDIQNSHERGEREKERAKSEVERLKGVAGDDSTRSSSLSQPQPRPMPLSAQKSTQGPQSVADRKRQWTQLAEMGIQVPEAFRSEMAMVGDWQKSSQQVIDEPSSEAPLSMGIKKRKYEGQEEDEEERQTAGEAVVRRGWGAATKTYPGHDNADLDDLLSGSIPVKKEEAGFLEPLVKDERSASQQGNYPALKEHGGARETYISPTREDSSHGNAIKPELAKEESDSVRASRPMLQVPEAVSTMPVFKKRKAKVLKN